MDMIKWMVFSKAGPPVVARDSPLPLIHMCHGRVRDGYRGLWSSCHEIGDSFERVFLSPHYPLVNVYIAIEAMAQSK